MQPHRAAEARARFWPWTVFLILGSIACGTGTINGPQGLDRRGPGSTGTGPTGGSTTTGGGSTTGGGGPQLCNPQDPRLSSTRVWRLTQPQLKNTLVDTFGYSGKVVDSLPDDSRLDGYANHPDGLGISSLLADYYFRAADEVAAEIVATSASFLKCPLASLDSTCLTTFLNDYGSRAWRRPLSDDERNKLTQLYTTVSQANGNDLGLRMVVQGLLLSPNSLYRTELGSTAAPGTTTKMTGYEIASALSYTLWDAPPDAPLLESAAAGMLEDPATLVGQARRLLSITERVAPSLHSFIQQWLQIDQLDRVQKDSTLYPTYTPAVVQALTDETNAFVDSVVFDAAGDRSLRTLLDASYGYANEATASIYGVAATGTALSKVALDPKQRRGLLTEAGFLAGHSYSNSTGLVGRGRFIRESVLCAPVPPPPGNFMFDPAVITDDMTERQKFEIHRKNPACAACHALFDPIGIAIQNYDPIGQYRTMDKGKPIDPSGQIPLADGTTIVKFSDYVDLLTQLSARSDVYDCFASQYLEYSMGRTADELDACDVQATAKAFGTSGYRIDDLVLAVVGLPTFVTRRN
jgi:hypothetical protein